MKLSELYWHRITPLHVILWPISVIYGLFLTLKKLCYWFEILPAVKLPVPVVIVDSISIDGGGKTPLVIWLVEYLVKQGYYPGIITRGDSDNPGAPVAVTSTSDSDVVGTKTVLLSQRCEEICPVWAGNDRVAVAQALLRAYPKCNIIICNDGAHHYRLERNFEIIAVDFTEQSFGNGLLMPAGPLRISLRHLNTIDFIVTNGKPNHQVDTGQWGKTFPMKLINEIAYNVLKPEIRKPISEFKNDRIHVVTNDDNSQKFVNLIQNMNLNAELHTFSENHRYIREDIHFPDADIILIPEEMALQCHHFAQDTLWALPEEVWVDSSLQTALLKKLNNTLS